MEILTWNIQAGTGVDGSNDISRIAQVIKDMGNPDIICLQEVARNFLQLRGRAGKVLVVNQDFVLLLTNLAIGESTSLRFQELIEEFESRGFFFDKKSQQALIRFYERVGNLDRMSDSGDAVYVRNAI